MPDYPENPGPLPASDLKNKSDGGKGPLGKQDFCSKDPDLVKHLQKMLVTLGYDLGTYGPDKDGVDGAFGKLTETAVHYFQENNLDWEANQLKVDALVGPRTSDALNRAMVGRWYDHYQTPGELVNDKPYHTVTSEFLTRGLSMEPGTSANAKVFVVGSIPTITEFMILYPALGLPAIMDNNMINVILLLKKDSDLLEDASGDDWTKVKTNIANQLAFVEWEQRDSKSGYQAIKTEQIDNLSLIDVDYKENDGKISYQSSDKEIDLVASRHTLEHLKGGAEMDISKVFRFTITFEGLGEKLYHLVNKFNKEEKYISKALENIIVPGGTPREIETEMVTLRSKKPIKPYHPFYVSSKEYLDISHITDIHISTRWELYERILKKNYPNNFNEKHFNNYNTTFNELLKKTSQDADIVLVTGDLIDYNRGHKIDLTGDVKNIYDSERDFEKDYLFNRNWVLFYELLTDNYQKPVFTILGNHEYLLNPYNTNARIRVSLINKPIPIIDIPIMSESNSFAGDMNLKEDEAQFEQPLEFSLNIKQGKKLGDYKYDHKEEKLAPMLRENASELIDDPKSGIWYTDKESGTWYFLVINPFKDYSFTYRKMSVLMLDWNVDQYDGSLITLPRPTKCISTEQFKLLDKWVKHNVNVRIFASHAPVYDPWEDLGNFYLERGILKRDHDKTYDYTDRMTKKHSPKLNLGAVEEKSRIKLLDKYIFDPDNPIHILLNGHSHTNRIFQLEKNKNGDEIAVLRREDEFSKWDQTTPFFLITTSGGPIGRTNEVAEWMDMLLPGYRIVKFNDQGRMKKEQQTFEITKPVAKIRDEVIDDTIKNDPNFVLPTGFLGIFEKHSIKRYTTFGSKHTIDPDLSAIIDVVSGNAIIKDLNDGRAIVVKKIDSGSKLSIENNDGTIVIEEIHGELIVNDNDDLINIDYNHGTVTINQNDDTLLIRENHSTVDINSNGMGSPGDDIVKIFDNYATSNVNKPNGNDDLIILKRNHKNATQNINYNNDTINVKVNKGTLNINSNEGGAMEVDSVINILDNSDGTINIRNNGGEVNINDDARGTVSELEKSGEVNYRSEKWLKDKYKFD